MSDPLPIELKKNPAPAPELPPPSDDAGSRALSDALRSSFFIVKIVMVILVLLFLGSGFFTVDPQHKAIVLRFGKPVGEGEQALLGPGFHWALPKPIDEVVMIPITTIQVARSTVGWYATTAEAEAAHNEPPPGPSLNPATDTYALTSDANIIHVRAALRYRITDPIRFHFDFADAPLFVTNALNNALLYATAHFTVDDALTRKVAAFRESVASRTSDLIDAQHLGVTVEQVDVEAIPPRQCQAKFAEVLQSSIKAHETSTKAQSYANEVLSKGRAEAESRLNLARVEKSQLVKGVEAEAKKFSDLLPQYKANPELFVRLRQAETMQKVLGTAQEKMFLPERADGKPRELRLLLSREPQKPTVSQQ